MLTTSTLATAEAHGSAPDPADAATPPAGKVQIGPSWDPDRRVWADAKDRRRVRGDRPEGASIHVAYAAPERRWDEALRRQLAGFEAERFPEGTAVRQTIIDEPPASEAWLRKLELPDLPVRWNAKTIEYLRYFRDDPKGQRLIAAWLRRMGRYEARLRSILAEVGVPEDLVYVAMIESGFDPSAQSSVGAAGMWQFMAQTGGVYGLERDYWVDDRLDFERASYAAATYLGDLKTRFGSWELALAAYNAGYGLVLQSIRANNSNNYWALTEIENGLPHQTCNYVPKLLAAAIVGRNREAFGITDPPEPALELIDVKIEAGTRLADLAAAIDTDADLLAEINASYLRARVPPDGGPATVRIPRDRHAAFTQLGGKVRSSEQPWTTYEVRLGEDLASIAAAHGLTERQLRRLNAIHDSGEIKSGVTLVVPTATPNPPASLPPLVAVPALEVPAGRKLVFFRVTRASSSSSIAASFGVAWAQVVAWNDLDPQARLVDGQLLQLLVAKDFDAAAAGVRVRSPAEVRHVQRGSRAHLEAVLADRELLRRGYKVKKGDTLKKIARKFDMSLGSLARINRVSRGHRPAEGELLLVYVAKGKKGGTVKAPEPKPTTLTTELAVAESLPAGGEGQDAKPPASQGQGQREATSETKDAPKRDPSTAKTSRVPGRRNAP